MTFNNAQHDTDFVFDVAQYPWTEVSHMIKVVLHTLV